MKKKIVILLAAHIFCSTTTNGQLSFQDKCDIYSQIIYELEIQVKKEYNQKELYVANHLLIIEDFTRFISTINPLFENELSNRNIDYNKFVHRTDSFNFKCFSKKIKLMQESDYYAKRKKYSKREKGICYFSNIGYYNNLAFVAVVVQLSYSRRYSNFYFFQKDVNWNIVYYKEGCD